MDEAGHCSGCGAVGGGAASKIFDDPIAEAIAVFRAAMADFRANAPDDNAGADAYASRSYRAPLCILERWELPAVSRAGALDALRLAVDAEADGDYVLVGPMLRAGLAYFESAQ